MTIHPPARLVGEPKKTKKEGRKTPETVANWLFVWRDGVSNLLVAQSLQGQSGAKPSPLQELSSLQAALHASVQVSEHAAESLHR